MSVLISRAVDSQRGPVPSSGGGRYRGGFPSWWRQIPAARRQRVSEGAQAAMRRGVRWCAGTSVLRRLLGSLERSGFAALLPSHPHSVRTSQHVARVSAPIRTHHCRTSPPLRSSDVHRAAYRMGCLPVAGSASTASGFALSRCRPGARTRGGAAGARTAPSVCGGVRGRRYGADTGGFASESGTRRDAAENGSCVRGAVFVCSGVGSLRGGCLR